MAPPDRLILAIFKPTLEEIALGMRAFVHVCARARVCPLRKVLANPCVIG